MKISYRSARLIALARDGRCLICGTVEQLTTHHCIPRRLCPVNAPENLVTVCRTCHDLIEDLDAVSADLTWAATYLRRTQLINAQRSRSIVDRAVELLQQGGIAHGWSHAISIARQEMTM